MQGITELFHPWAKKSFYWMPCRREKVFEKIQGIMPWYLQNAACTNFATVKVSVVASPEKGRIEEGGIRTIVQGQPVKDAIHDVSASSTDSRSKPDSTETEDVKEIIQSAISTEAVRMILIPDSNTGWSQTRGLRLKEEGLQKTAQTAMLVNKQSLSQEKISPQRDKNKNSKTATMKQKVALVADNS